MNLDCYDFYLWSIGLLHVKQDAELIEFFLPEEEN